MLVFIAAVFKADTENNSNINFAMLKLIMIYLRNRILHSNENKQTIAICKNG